MKAFILTLVTLLNFISPVLSEESFCISHRGNGGGHLENSLSAIQSAIDLGSHGVEFDIVHTFDQEPILMHDSTLRRTTRSKRGKKCPRRKKINYIFLKEIEENCELKNGEDIPHLEKALLQLSNDQKFFFIELKDYPSVKTLRLLKKHFQLKPQFLRVISFKKSVQTLFAILKKQDPFWDKVKFLRLYLSKRTTSKVDGLNIKFPITGLKKWVRKNKKRELGVWNVISAKQIIKADKLKIKFITTDDPVLCLETLL